MRKPNRKGRVATFSFVVVATLGEASGAQAAGCVSSADLLTLSCTGTLAIGSGLPITIYDAAAAFQPIKGSNSYTPDNPAFPAATNPNNPGYDPNPPNVTLNFDNTVSANVINPTSASLADRGLVAANFSNTESPAVNNVVLNNAGSLAFSTNQIATARIELIVADSQVNSFTVNNKGTLSATQTFFSSFDPTKLSVTASGTPATYTAKYNGATLNDMAVLYTDDNTNSFTLNNAAGGKILATGNFATVYYGRADTTIVNSGVIAHTSWRPTDTLATGHWAIATWGGAEFETIDGTNPDSPLNVVSNIQAVDGVAQGTIAIGGTSALTLTNKASGSITGDILALDITPLVYAANGGNPAAVSGSNAGPRDSNIQNYGLINGNFYLGSGTHVVDNAAGATINGNFSVDQRPSTATFSAALTEDGTPLDGAPAADQAYQSAGGTDFAGNACPAAGDSTTNAGCAASVKVLASYVGGQSFTLTNEGVLNGNIVINDQPGSVNSITLTGTGFSGNIVALNGTGSNSLTLYGVTNLASVRNFSELNLNASRVAVANGVSLVAGSTLTTTVYGAGGSHAAPSTKLGSIYGTLTLAGPTVLTPTFTTLVNNGATWVVASSVNGPGSVATTPTGSVLVSTSASTSTGALLLTASVVDPHTIPGLSRAGASTLAGLLSYTGSSAKVNALGAAVEALPDFGAVRAAGESLGPQVNGAAIQIPLAIATLFQGQVNNRLDSLLSARAPTKDRWVASAGPVESPAAGGAVWASAIDGSATQSTTEHIHGYSANFAGVIGGYDRQIAPGARLGAAFGYVSSQARDSGLFNDNTGVSVYQGLVYGSLDLEKYYVRGSVADGGLNYNTSRTISFPGFSDAASATHGGNLFSASIEAGAPVQFGASILTPYAGFTYANIAQNAYAETSSNGAALTYRSVVNDSERSVLGAKALIPINAIPLWSNVASTSAIDLELRAAYLHEFGDLTQSVTASFIGASNPFIATGPNPSRNLLDFGAGLHFDSGAFQFALTYDAIARTGYLEQAGLFKARYAF
ncbi:autotransporter outer membrane beta-barrel domain-containing protein [uncultured Rhodoblastus sp.]|uniref:autotransporter outer membrane beta-barrel domain-containing protein n=1 Tax=uncultured Rhodoblastus sp. TaxID=543037 RepID=UPI0025F72CC7|nr:autotransporter outer membrane beta-barrel domain-containing protein [uncultured Rhodoblastus sp.]